MSERGIIEVEGSQTCESCGKVDETRPYGPEGIEVCHPCLECHPEWEREARARADNLLFGEPLPKEFQ